MKILHVTDLHFNRRFFDWVVDVRSFFDVICLTGDLLEDSLITAVDKENQIDWVRQWLKEFDAPVLVCSGNHDEQLDLSLDLDQLCSIDQDGATDEGEVFDAQDSAPWLKNIDSPMVAVDNEIRVFSGVTFGCIPYQCDEFERFASCDVVLYHEPPSGLSVARTHSQDIGCPRMRSALKEKLISPDWLLSGHVHVPESTLSVIRNTQVSNPGASVKAEKPRHREISLSGK